jgi:hypothetical protein
MPDSAYPNKNTKKPPKDDEKGFAKTQNLEERREKKWCRKKRFHGTVMSAFPEKA